MLKVQQTAEAIEALELVGVLLAGAFKDGAQVTDLAVITAGLMANIDKLKAGFTGLGQVSEEWKALGLREGINEGAEVQKRLNDMFWKITDAAKKE
jgi:hypothetical protein